MRLLYWYTQFLDSKGNPRKHRGLTHFEINLSTTDLFHFDPKKNELTSTPLSEPLPPDFWGNRIYNINVLTGNNGAGKSAIMNYIMDVLYQLYSRNLKSDDRTVFILEADRQQFAIQLSRKTVSEIKMHNQIKQYSFIRGVPFLNPLLEILDKTKIIYLSNTLNEDDDQRVRAYKYPYHVRNHFIYDCSTSGVMHFNRINDSYAKDREDLLLTYFMNEHYKQVKYVFNRKQYTYLAELKNAGKPVPVPKSLEIRILDSIRGYAPELGFTFPDNLTNCDHSSKSKRIACILCFGCLMAFVENLTNNWNSSPNLDEIDLKDGLNLEDFENLFSAVMEDAFPLRKKRIISNKNSTRVSTEDEANELCRHCISFVQFVFEDIERLANYFQITSEWSYKVDISLDSNVDFEWLMDFMNHYQKTCAPYYFLDFSWGLSSGENNLLSMFSSLYYLFERDDDHIKNLKQNSNPPDFDDTILLFIDEADLTYHPEWQRQFISVITAFLPKVFRVRKIKDIQVLLSTHSPLLLGDMPKHNVTFLREGNSLSDTDKPETFGQNIHQILKDGFFLANGTVGAFAAEKINNTAEKLRETADHIRKDGVPLDDQGEKDYSKIQSILNDCKQIIDLVAPGVLKGKLMDLYKEVESLLYGGDCNVLNQNATSFAKMMSDEELKAYILMLQREQERRSRND